MVDIPCPSGCGVCCGVMFFELELWEGVKDRVQYGVARLEVSGGLVLAVPVVEDNLFVCPFLSSEKKCVIYDLRPAICREYGSEEVPCPYYNSLGVKRCRQERRRVQRLIDKWVDKVFGKHEVSL